MLLLDNLEQVAEAAPEVAELLASSPSLMVLATSRAPLRLRASRSSGPAAPVPTSPAPTGRALRAERLLEVPAVALFVERAQAARPDFALTDQTATAVAAICVRLDGLPLAIELAAVRVKQLPLAQLLQRLERRLPLLVGGARDLEARQQTMHAAISWSEDLLSPEEQRLFRRLAVFVGGCTLEAAEAVCATPVGAEPLGTDVLEGLGHLVDQSLVQQHTVAGKVQENRGARFRLLFVIREYALDRLEAAARGGRAVRPKRYIARQVLCAGRMQRISLA